jgi:arylsulfatase A-like enzyme
MMTDKPVTQEAIGHSSLEVFDFAFKWWLFIFITFLIPLDIIYRISHLLSGLSPLQLVSFLSSTVVLFASVALIIASISLALGYLCKLINFNGSIFIIKANTILGLYLIVVVFMHYMSKWVSKVFNLSINSLNIYIHYVIFGALLIIAIGPVFYKGRDMLKQIKSITGAFFRANIYVSIFCTICVVVFVLVFSYPDIGEIEFTASAQKDRTKSYPNVIIITFDALTAQHMSLYGFHYQTTPNIDKLGQNSYVFDNMYSSSNWTLPSLSSLMSGKYPMNHGVINPLSYFWGYNRTQNLPFYLKKLGYETAVVWSNQYSCPWNSNIKGFDHILPANPINKFFYDIGNSWLVRLGVGILIQNRIYQVINLFNDLSLIDELREAIKPEFSFSKASEILSHQKKPFFLWVHIRPPHHVYLPGDGFLYSILKEKIFDTRKAYLSPPFNKMGAYPPKDQSKVDKISLRYDEHISYADHEFGEFLSSLKSQGLIDNSILIVSADHGEMFQRGFWSHGGPYLYQPQIHIPLVIHLPGQVQGQRIGANVNHVDIAPTILDLLGVRTPAWMDGSSFSPIFTDRNFDTGTKLSMNLSYVNCSEGLMTQSIAAIRGDYKLIKYLNWDRYELYDLKKDPQEQINLIASKPAVLSSLKDEIDRALAK